MTSPNQLTSVRLPASALPLAVEQSIPFHSPSIRQPGYVAISVCIPNWNCRQYLEDCLNSLFYRDQGISFEVIIVDNASEDGAPEMVESRFPEVRLVRNSSNRGFAFASNQAADLARGEYIFFLNNDTVIPEGTLRKLYDFAREHPEAGLIGPRIRDPLGRLQISYRRKPTVAALLHRTMLFRWSGVLKGTYYDYRRTNFQSTQTRPVEALMGAAVLMPRQVYQTSGGWDNDFPFGGEDLELSIRINRTHSVYYVPSIELMHYGRISSRLNASFAAPNVSIGYIHFFRKTGQNPWAIRLYKLVVTVDAPIHLACKSMEWCWRTLIGREAKAKKTGLMIQGLWAFLRRDLVRFWRT